MDNGSSLLTEEELLVAAAAQQPPQNTASQEAGVWHMHNSNAHSQSAGKDM